MQAKPNILVISNFNGENSARPEAEIFVGLIKAGYPLSFVSQPPGTYYNQRFRELGATVYENFPKKKIDRAFIKWLRAFIRVNKIDIVHAFNSKGLTNAIWAMQGSPAKLITYRGYAGNTHWYDPMMYFKYFHPRVDHIICVSEDIRNILARNMVSGHSKLSVIRKGHDPEWYAHVRPTSRREMGFRDDEVLLTFVANLRPFKGLPDLMNAMEILPADLPVQFLLIGDGYTTHEINALVEASPYKERIHRLGFRADSTSVMRMSDGYICASTHGEGLTKTLVEAMSLSLACIATDIPGNAGLIIPDETGWLIPVHDPPALAAAIQEVILHKEERQRRGKQAKEHIAISLHIRDTVKAFESLYQKLLEA